MKPLLTKEQGKRLEKLIKEIVKCENKELLGEEE